MYRSSVNLVPRLIAAAPLGGAPGCGLSSAKPSVVLSEAWAGGAPALPPGEAYAPAAVSARLPRSAKDDNMAGNKLFLVDCNNMPSPSLLRWLYNMERWETTLYKVRVAVLSPIIP